MFASGGVLFDDAPEVGERLRFSKIWCGFKLRASSFKLQASNIAARSRTITSTATDFNPQLNCVPGRLESSFEFGGTEERRKLGESRGDL